MCQWKVTDVSSITPKSHELQTQLVLKEFWKRAYGATMSPHALNSVEELSGVGVATPYAIDKFEHRMDTACRALFCSRIHLPRDVTEKIALFNPLSKLVISEHTVFGGNTFDEISIANANIGSGFLNLFISDDIGVSAGSSVETTSANVLKENDPLKENDLLQENDPLKENDDFPAVLPDQDINEKISMYKNIKDRPVHIDILDVKEKFVDSLGIIECLHVASIGGFY